MTRLPYRLIVAAVTSTLIGMACSTAAQPAGQMSPTTVVATIGAASVTLGEVDAIALQESVSSFGSARLGQALYLARRSALDRIIGSRLIEEEARTRGLAASALVTQEIDAKVKPVTDTDIDFWYESNPGAVQGRPLSQLRDPIRSLLTDQRSAESHKRFVDVLRAKTAVSDRLEPPRQVVATAGRPRRGPASAPIEIVEFSDFQCPFCQRANPIVEQVLKTYGDRVRFVYRHYPLPNHVDARPAAEAAACADAQGKFWEYHDLLFASPDRLKDADLKGHAARLGLEAATFGSCVDTHATKAIVDQDIKDAEEAGVSATPSFFVNGRSLEGAQPFEAFKRIIDEELAVKR